MLKQLLKPADIRTYPNILYSVVRYNAETVLIIFCVKNTGRFKKVFQITNFYVETPCVGYARRLAGESVLFLLTQTAKALAFKIYNYGNEIVLS